MNKYPNVWGGGQLLAFSGIDGKTDFNNGITLRTGYTGYEIQFQNGPFSATPPAIRFCQEVKDVELTGDFFRFYAEDGSVSSGVLPDNYHVLLDGDFDIELQGKYEVGGKDGKILIGRKDFFNPALLDLDVEAEIAKRAKFIDNAVLPEYISDNARRTALKALSQIKTQTYAPEGCITNYWSTPDRWPHKKMWLWDSVFHALGMRHINLDLAKQFINAMFEIQQPDGLIPHSGSPYGHVNLTQPPVLSLAMRIINEMSPDPEWIAALAPKLERYIEWIFANRDSDGAGLVEWAIEANENCRSGESGMDNSPRFDGAIQLDAPDFNAFLAYECESLAMFLPEKRDYWMGHYNRLCKLMNERLWSDKVNLYVDYDVVGNERTDIMSSAGFLPLLCGAASPEQAAKMAAHLTDPETFGTPLRVPSIAKKNTQAYKKDMWRGPVWTNINYMICLGLERYGYHELAKSIIQDTMHEQEKFYLQFGTFFEFHDDRKEVTPPELERKGKMPETGYHPFHQVFHDYGWSGTLYLEMLFCKEWN